ncbi:MAG: polymerase [Gemmatimonadetes bacterium]|nr:polymerase [Gemmatimonadota bacterium]
MTPRDVAAVLAQIATLMEIAGGNPFRAKAFATAARKLESADVDLAALAEAGALTSLPGIGEGIAGVVDELVRTGRSGMHERLVADTPPGLFDVMRVPGLGLKRVRTLYAELGVDSLDALEREARAGRVAALAGFGARTEAKVLDGLAFARASRGLRRYPDAMESAVALLEWARAQPAVESAEIAGALRRRVEVVNAVELVAASGHPATVLAAFRALGGASAGEAEDGRVSIHLSDGLPVRLRCVRPDAFVAAMVVDTGSVDHVLALAARAAERKLALDADGLRKGRKHVPVADEEALYRALALQYVPPELREGWGEVEAAEAGRIPTLVEADELRGTFHCHTDWSDGRATLEEMAQGARAKGWEYLGIADHSRSAGYAGGLPPAKAKQQMRAIDAWNEAHGGKGAGRFRLFKGTESDILADGRLDYDDDVLAAFDYVVGSVHSAFNLPEREMTDRMVRAVSNPRLTMLGHPTGRLLLTREGYHVDVRAVIDAAAQHGVAVEINADPHRLDLDWQHVRYAAGRGVLVPVNPDAHSVRGLDNVAFGVHVARKGWLSARQVLNTWTLPEVEQHFAERKQAGPR